MTTLDSSKIKVEKRELHVPTLDEVKNGIINLLLSNPFFVLFCMKLIFLFYFN